MEQADLIKSLLDVEASPRKPIYELADPAGLVLFDCLFDQDLNDDKLGDNEDGLESLRQPLADAYRDSAVVKCLSSLSGGNLKVGKRVKYTPIMRRATAPSLEEKLLANGAKRRRLDNQLDDVD